MITTKEIIWKKMKKMINEYLIMHAIKFIIRGMFKRGTSELIYFGLGRFLLQKNILPPPALIRYIWLFYDYS